MNNVYLIVSDLHYAVSKAHRKNYLDEVITVMEQIIGVRDKYANLGYSPNLIFLGDVFDGNITKSDDAMRSIDLFKYFTSLFARSYAVVGNHEETYTENNPFWFLASSIEDEDLRRFPRALQPQSISACISIPSVIVDGNVRFYFNHFGTPPKVPELSNNANTVNIGLFHQNVGSNDICKMWGTFDNVEEASYVQGYQYLFFGHMHLAYGKYYLNDAHTCLGEWLGALCCTNVNEVESAPVGVNLPVVLVEDGDFVRVEDNLINRKDPKEVIDYPRLELYRESDAKLKEIKSVEQIGIVGHSLMECVRNAADTASLLGVLELLGSSYEHVRYMYRRALNEDLIMEEVASSEPQEDDV